MRDKEAQSLLPSLRSRQSALSDLVERAERIAYWNQVLREWTREPWFDSIRLANVRGDTVVLYASNAAVLVPLRYRQESLINFLRQRLQLPCVKIETKVRPLIHTGLSRV